MALHVVWCRTPNQSAMHGADTITSYLCQIYPGTKNHMIGALKTESIASGGKIPVVKKYQGQKVYLLKKKRERLLEDKWQ